MLGLQELLKARGLLGEADRVKLVRHKDKRYALEERVGSPWFDLYQAFQKSPVFRECTHIVTFLGEDGTTSRLIGVYEVGEERAAAEVVTETIAAEHQLGPDHLFYELRKLPAFADLEGRVVIDWGKGALAWHQWFSDREILEVRPTGRALPQFDDYLNVHLTYKQLKDLVDAPQAHADWVAGLRAVGGVYLIVNSLTGEQYVGSATGDDGIWGRWSDYANSKHGGNKALKTLCESSPAYPDAFRFSILNTFARTTTKQEAIDRESFFKAKLGSRAFGLNLN